MPLSTVPSRRPWWLTAAWLTLLLLAFGVGLAHLGDYGADYDEGVLLQTAVLAHHHYPLYDPVVLNKPPLLIWWLQGFFTLAGPTISTARLSILLLNMVGLAALGALAARWWGRWAGPTAVLLFLLLPDTLPRLPTVTPDLPAMSLMLLSLFAASRAQSWQGTAVAGLFFALGLGIHPLLLFMAVPIVLTLIFTTRKMDLTQKHRDIEKRKNSVSSVLSVVKKSVPDLFVFGGTAVTITLLWLILVDWPGFQQWVIAYNRAPLDATLTAVAAQNGQKIIRFLLNHWPLLLLALLPLFYRSPITVHRLPITVCLLWLAAATATLYTLQPMWEHYLIFLLYPLVLLASGGVVTVIFNAKEQRGKEGKEENEKRSLRPSVGLLLFMGLLAVYAAVNLAAPRPWGEWPTGYKEAAAVLQRELPPGGFMLTDEPFLAFMAGQLLPPPLADSSTKRIATGLLQPTDVINAQLAYGVRYGLWGNGRFQQLPALTNWADSAATSQTDLGDLTLYEFVPLTPTIPLHAQLEPGIQLRGYTLHPSPDDQTLPITLFWEADSPLPADYKILLHLLDESGQPIAQADGEPMGGWLPTTAWKPGVMVPHTAVLPLPANATPPYTLATGLYTWPNLARLPAFQSDGSRWPNDLIIVSHINP